MPFETLCTNAKSGPGNVYNDSDPTGATDDLGWVRDVEEAPVDPR